MKDEYIQIFFDDLMKECNIDDPKEFRRLLKVRGIKPISKKKPINKKLAVEIVYRITGRKIELYKYKLKERDRLDEGPLQRKTTKTIKNKIEDWFCKITPETGIKRPQHDHLLGFVCSGGFLIGSQSSYFPIKLDSSINIMIGDRGAGKSTALNLCSILANSISEETDILVTMLLNILKVEAEETSDFSRRVRKVLRQYGIINYACFYRQKQKTICYYVDIKKGIFSLLERQNREQKWISSKQEYPTIGNSMQILQQGEVLRIADENNKFYLNNILDALYPNLYRKRQQFTFLVKKIDAQFANFKPTHWKLNYDRLYRFIDQRYAELQQIWMNINDGNVNDNTIPQILKEYIDLYNSIDHSQIPKSIVQLLNSSSYDTLYALYLGNSIDYLMEKLSEIEQLSDKELGQISTLFVAKNKEGLNTEKTDKDLIQNPLSIDNEDLSLLSQRIEKLSDQDIDIEQEEEVEVVEETQKIIKERKIFLKSSLKKVESSVHKKLIGIAREIANFLHTRIIFLRALLHIYKKSQVVWNSPLQALVERYINLINKRIELIKEQEKKCHSITLILNKDDIGINVFTNRGQKVIATHRKEIRRLNKISEIYYKLEQATPSIKFSELLHLSNIYEDTVTDFLERLTEICSDIITPESTKLINLEDKFLFNPIKIELQQGSVYRDFEQLSFGQKSGIILKMVLESANKNIIILDQPEDNLDAHSIVNMLAPTLKSLGTNRQIIIATHNSSLVMGLHSRNLLVLESLGYSGRIRIQGSIYERDVTREMLDVLEGGIPSFELKMKIYEDFIHQVSGVIQDMDIMMIENSFRRRTIDGLRNFLQPIISDRSLLDFLRHELKQRDSSRIHKDIHSVRENLLTNTKNENRNWNKLIEQVDSLFDRLDKHIVRMQESIEEIRLMDTQPRPRKFNIYNMLLDIKNEYITKISKKRKIHIEISSQLADKLIYADEDHFKLIFRNLLNNSLRATEKKVIENMFHRHSANLIEEIRIEIDKTSEQGLALLYMDNGSGILPEIRQKLYIERCSDQKGKDHGQGGIIIRKLLDLNNGSIQILESTTNGYKTGTIQRISIDWESNKR